MSIIDDLRSLDTSDPGRWPLPFRIGAIAIAFVAVAAFGIYMFVIKAEMPLLERAQNEEVGAASHVRATPAKGGELRCVPGAARGDRARRSAPCCGNCRAKTEIPNLLVDIAQTGLGAGLEEKLFQRRRRDSERLLRRAADQDPAIRGSYHELGNFVSGIAALPRIVTLHDISIRPVDDDTFDELTLDVTAKTYRYLDEETAPGAEG